MSEVILTQTDTTVGFLSQSSERLAHIKERPHHKPFIKSFDSLRRYCSEGGRVPAQFKNRLRRSHSATYVINNQALRIVSKGAHHQLLKKYGWLYSTSANAKGKSFDFDFAYDQSDLIIEERTGLFEGTPSHIFKINQNKIKKLR